MSQTAYAEPRSQPAITNEEIAATLEQIAELLATQGANPFRVDAYRAAAYTVRNLDEPACRIVEVEGTEALTRFPGIGRNIPIQWWPEGAYGGYRTPPDTTTRLA